MIAPARRLATSRVSSSCINARPASSGAALATGAAGPSKVDAAAASQMKKAEAKPTRFWKRVAVQQVDNGEYTVALDTRPLRTPGKKPFRIPPSKLPLAVLVAREWDEQRKVLQAHGLPMTSLTARALDDLQTPAGRAAVVAGLMKFLETDTVCFHEPSPKALVDMQDRHWKPLISWVNRTFGVDVKVHESLLGLQQDSSSSRKLQDVVSRYDAFKLAAFERAVHSTKSFIIALALVEGHLTVDQASDASRVEVLSQIERWGEVEDTHDVDHQDIRSRLGSCACLLIDLPVPSP